MKGSSPRVFIAVPNLGRVLPETVVAVGDIIAATKDLVASVLYLTCAPLDLARHLLVREFLADPKNSHLFFLDADMGPPPDALRRLLALGRPIACLPCPILAPSLTHRGPTVTTNIWNHVERVTSQQDSRLVRYFDPDEMGEAPMECDGTGLACCLIERTVFENLSLPFFQYVCSPDFAELRIGEDGYFFNQARAAGFRIAVDPGAMCEHYKEVDLTHLEEFFRDEPVTWPISQTPVNTDSQRSIALAVLGGEHDCHAATADFLTNDINERFAIKVFDSADWGRSLREAVRWFLNRSESSLFLLDRQCRPSPSLLDRLFHLGVPCASGISREKAGREVVLGVRGTNDRGRLAPLEDDALDRDRPFEVDAVSLRAALLQRNLLMDIGTAWLRDGATPASAGDDLAAAMARRKIRPVVLPIGVRCFGRIGLGQLLEAKIHLRKKFTRGLL